MDGFNIIDAVVIGVILLSAILAYARGFVREVMAVVGWVAAAVVAYYFAPQAEPLIREVPVLKKFLEGSCELTLLAAFAVVFALALVVFAFFTPLMSSLVRNSLLSGPDRALGFLYGVARGVLLVAVALIVYQRAMADEAVPMVAESQTARIFAQFEQKINADIPDKIPTWLENVYDGIAGKCGAPAPASDALTGPGNTDSSAAPATGATGTTGTTGGTTTGTGTGTGTTGN